MENKNQNKKKSTFQNIMFKIFACPIFILLLILIGNYLIFGGIYDYIGYQIIILIILMIIWTRDVEGVYKMKLLISKD